MRAVFVLAALAALIWSAPVSARVRADLNASPSYAAEIRIYGLRLRFAGRIRLRRGGKKKSRFLRRLLPRFALGLLRLPGSGLRLAATVGTGDAALTALCAGSLQTIFGAANALCPTQGRARPDFAGAGFCLSACCIVTARGGDIIRTGVRAAKSARTA